MGVFNGKGYLGAVVVCGAVILLPHTLLHCLYILSSPLILILRIIASLLHLPFSLPTTQFLALPIARPFRPTPLFLLVLPHRHRPAGCVVSLPGLYPFVNSSSLNLYCSPCPSLSILGSPTNIIINKFAKFPDSDTSELLLLLLRQLQRIVVDSA